jgi:hypothetical protein
MGEVVVVVVSVGPERCVLLSGVKARRPRVAMPVRRENRGGVGVGKGEDDMVRLRERVIVDVVRWVRNEERERTGVVRRL